MTSDLRRRALDAIDDLDGGAATGPEVLRRLRENSVAGESGAGDRAPTAESGASADEPLLYPVLHRLEADWKIRATWQARADGTLHRTYRRRRLMLRGPGNTVSR
jgi:hypothetical protein